MLEKVQAPECPKCGCNSTQLVNAGQQLGRVWAGFECDFCGHHFTLGQSPNPDGVINGVVYESTNCQCPRCGAKNPPVVSTKGRIRYHKCACHPKQFKSVERV